MKTITILSAKRKDGKYKVRYVYQGSPNMFGGFDPSTTYNSLHTAERIREHGLYPGDRFINKSGEPDSVFF